MNISSFGSTTFTEKFIALMMLVYPALMISVRGGMNEVFFLVFILSILVFVTGSGTKFSSDSWKNWWQYIAAMAALPVAVLLSQGFHHDYYAHPYDAASRYVLAVPIFMLLRRARFEIVALVQYGFPIGAVTGLLMAQYVDGGDGLVGGRLSTYLDLDHFGDFELLLGFMSALCINWSGKDGLLLRSLKIIGFSIGVYASFRSGGRGGWIAIPVFITIFTCLLTKRITWRTILLTLLAIVVSSYLIITFNLTVKQRMSQLANDVVSLNQGKVDTSTGIRWQLYKAAVDVFSRHPVFGVGPEGFALEMQPMMEAGKITPNAAELGRGEVHNDILSKTAGMGVFGLFAILAIYFVPFRLFWTATKSASAHVKRAGILGITFVSGFFVFGLTVEVLNLTMATAFYSFTLAVLLAACYNIHHDERFTNSNKGSHV